MQYFPDFNVTRYAQLSGGELFFIGINGTQFAAIKAIDVANDGDKLMVLLGPSFTTQYPPGCIVDGVPATVLSLGQDYHVGLPTEPQGWSIEPPPPAVVAMVLKDDELYVRANSGTVPGEFAPCLVKLEDGVIVYGRPGGIVSYASNWRIAIEDPRGDFHTVLQR